jgi:D-psicose/D-tagatose/L-ribulose 3-epimerase
VQVGINAWCWGAPITTEKLEEIAPHAAEMGFDLLEIPIESVGDLDYERGREILDENGLDASVVVAMTEDRDLLVDEDTRANGRAYVRDCIDAMETLGATNLVGPLYAAVGRTWKQSAAEREADVELLVDQLSELAAYADDRGVVLCVEPLNRFETSFLNTAEQAVEVVDRVDSDACRILLDTFHMSIEEKSFRRAIEAAGPRVAHVHANGNDRGAPGNGHLPWDGIAASLEDVGYDGPLVIETFTPEVESIAKAAAIWRALEPSQNQLARDGLSFLRETFGA